MRSRHAIFNNGPAVLRPRIRRQLHALHFVIRYAKPLGYCYFLLAVFNAATLPDFFKDGRNLEVSGA
jgi:hypothetical protein